MPRKPESKFKGKLKAALEMAGAMVSNIEPAFGSSPGIPDLAVAWGLKDFWIETKIIEKRIPTPAYVWNDLLRPDQRIWFLDREKAMQSSNEYQIIPAFVAVEVRAIKEILLYSYSQSFGLSLIDEISLDPESSLVINDLPSIVEYLSRYCEILKVEDLKK